MPKPAEHPQWFPLQLDWITKDGMVTCTITVCDKSCACKCEVDIGILDIPDGDFIPDEAIFEACKLTARGVKELFDKHSSTPKLGLLSTINWLGDYAEDMTAAWKAAGATAIANRKNGAPAPTTVAPGSEVSIIHINR